MILGFYITYYKMLQIGKKIKNLVKAYVYRALKKVENEKKKKTVGDL